MIEGRYFEPMSAQSKPARLWGVAGDLRLEVEGDASPRRPTLASLSDRLGSVPRKFTFEDGGVFEAPADADVDGLMASHGSFFSVLSRLEANGKFIAVAVVATFVLLFGIYRYGLPLAASAAANATPTAIVDLMDAGTLQTVDQTFFSPSTLDADRKAQITAMFDELARISGQKDPDLELHFRDGGALEANAFALPGGTIVITDQLINLAENDDEIAGVLAHEIGHVQNRHGLQQIYRLLGITFMIGLIGGDSSQIVDDVIGQAAALQTFAYTREFETDADNRSVEIMVEAGRNPIAFVDLLDRITKDSPSAKKTGWMSTHPGTEDRRNAVTEKARALDWRG
jgi:Zn-dependent protease with chaperone function